MKKIWIILSILSALTIYQGCGGDNPAEPSPSPVNSSGLSKFSQIQNQIFSQNCTSSGCHGTANNQANLLLTEGNSFSNLVNVQSVLFPQYKRVVPGNSSQSLLIKILKGEVSPQMPLNRTPLPAEIIDSIAAWIDDGALNN